MVKPSVYAIDPTQKKAQDKAREDGQVEVPIQTDKLQDELAVKTTQEGAKRKGCCASLRKWQKIAIGVFLGLLVIGCIGFFTLRMLGITGVSWCGTDDSLDQGHRWDEMKGDFYDRFGEDGMPREGKDGNRTHGSGEEGHGRRPGGSGEHGGEHRRHHGPDHGPRPGPHDHANHEHSGGRSSSEEVDPAVDGIPMADE